MPNVQRAMTRRLDGLNDPRWVDAMVVLIENERNAHFRWFDSGDLQSPDHLAKIIEIARRLPRVSFWLPTQEQTTILGAKTPSNLTIRVTAPVINPVKLPAFPNIAVVLSGISKPSWAKRVESNASDFWFCPASAKTPSKCGECRACWDKSVRTVAYRGK